MAISTFNVDDCKHPARIKNDKGESVCAHCGMVLEETIIDSGPEWRTFVKDGKNEKSRVGAYIDNTVHDGGMSTVIGISRTTKSPNERRKMWRLKYLQESSRVKSSKRKEVTALSELGRACSKLGVSRVSHEDSAQIIKKAIREDLTRRIPLNALVGAAIFKACNMHDEAKTQTEIMKALDLKRDELWNALKKISPVLEEKGMKKERIDAKKFVPQIVTTMSLPEKVTTLASKIIDAFNSSGLSSGKGQLPLAAAAVYISSIILNNKRNQKEIAKAQDITEVTIRNRYREIVDNFNIIVKI